MRGKVCLAILTALAGVLLPTTSAQAWVRVGIGITVPVYGPYYRPYPYYYPPVVVAPATVVVQPAPTVVQPAPAYVQPAPTSPYTAPNPAPSPTLLPPPRPAGQ
jgi:hypothetical protein